MKDFYAVVLMGVLPLCVLAKQGCQNLRIFNETGEILNFPCNDYDGTDSCRNGPSRFPANLSVGLSVGKPRDFQANPFMRNFSVAGNKYRAPGMLFKWKVPIEQISRQLTKGYFLKIHRAGRGSYECRLFDLQALDLTSPKMNFSYELFPFNNTAREIYSVTLFSLPLPSHIEYAEGLYENIVISLPRRLNYSSKNPTYPGYWTTWTKLQQYPEEGKIQVEFGYPDPGSNAKFTSYTIQLWNASNSHNSLQSVILNKTGSETVGRYNFSNVPTGTYVAKIRPYDPFLNDRTMCLCWFYQYRRKDCRLCALSKSEDFNFTRIKPPPVTTTDSVEGRTDGSDSRAAILAGSIAGSIAGLAVLGVCFLIWKQKKPRRRHQGETGSQSYSNDPRTIKGNGHMTSFPSVDTIASRKQRIIPLLKTKTVLMLASEDHQLFSQALAMFAQFLKIHCHCDVLFAPQQMMALRKTVNSYCWLSAQIDSADFVVIVASEAASHLYAAFQKGQVYKEADFGPEGDLFTPGIQHICGKIARSESVHKVMMVHFDHTSPNLRLPIGALPARLYHLPHHLAFFLHHIHGLDENTMDLSQVTLPLQGNVEELAGGKEWLTTVRRASVFENFHPDWFERKFGKPVDVLASSRNPEYYKLDSEGSGIDKFINSDSFQHRLSSVSNHAGDAEDKLSCGAEGTPRINKADFIAPSELLTDENSAVTVDFSAYMLTERPAEIDGGSSFSEQFRKINEQYEHEKQRIQDCVPEEESLIISDQNCSHLAELFPFRFQTDALSSSSHTHVDLDHESLSSAQSV